MSGVSAHETPELRDPMAGRSRGADMACLATNVGSVSESRRRRLWADGAGKNNWLKADPGDFPCPVIKRIGHGVKTKSMINTACVYVS